MKKNAFIYLFPISYFLYSLIFFISNKYVYMSIIDNYLGIIAFTLGSVSLHGIIRKISTKKMIVTHTLLIVFLVGLFIWILPTYTYEEAKDLISRNMALSNKNMEIIVYKSTSFRSSSPIKFMIHSGYVIIVKKNNEVSYLMFNPVNGQYSVDNKLFENIK